MSEAVATRTQSRGVSMGTLKWLLGVAASITIGYAAFSAGQGAQGQRIIDHERRITNMEEWQGQFIESNHEFQLRTTNALTRIEAKLEDIRRR